MGDNAPAVHVLHLRQRKLCWPICCAPLAAPSWCCCAFACVWYLPRTPLPTPFLTGEATSAKKCKQVCGVGRRSGKQAVLTRARSSHGSWRLSHSCLLSLESVPSFLRRWESAECSSCFVASAFRSGFPSSHYVLFGGRGFAPIEPCAGGRCVSSMAFGRPPTSPRPPRLPTFLCSRSSCSLSQLPLWLAHHKPTTINRWLENF